MSSKTLAEAQNIRNEIEKKLKNITSPYRLNLIRRSAQKHFNEDMHARKMCICKTYKSI